MPLLGFDEPSVPTVTWPTCIAMKFLVYLLKAAGSEAM